ncbi:MAG: hypothetical protein SGARI_002566, partial [Bacillariaceae sp.]
MFDKASDAGFGWAMEAVGLGANPNDEILDQLRQIDETLTEIKDQLSDVQNAIQDTQFNILAGQVQPYLSSINNLHSRFIDYTQIETTTKSELRELSRTIMDEVPKAIQIIFDKLIGSGDFLSDPGLIAKYAQIAFRDETKLTEELSLLQTTASSYAYHNYLASVFGYDSNPQSKVKVPRGTIEGFLSNLLRMYDFYVLNLVLALNLLFEAYHVLGQYTLLDLYYTGEWVPKEKKLTAIMEEYMPFVRKTDIKIEGDIVVHTNSIYAGMDEAYADS